MRLPWKENPAGRAVMSAHHAAARYPAIQRRAAGEEHRDELAARPPSLLLRAASRRGPESYESAAYCA
jgi:hypothetical protein